MGDNDHRAALLRKIQHDVQHLANHLGVQGGRHLVEQQNLGVHSQRTDNGDALLLAAGQLTRVALGLAQQTYAVQQGLGLLLHLGFRALGHLLGGQHHVVQHSQVREQFIALEHHANALPQAGKSLAAVGNRLVAQPHAAALGRFQGVDAPQQRTFSAAAGADDHNDFTGADSQADIVQNGIFTIALDKMLHSQNWFCHGFLPPLFL